MQNNYYCCIYETTSWRCFFFFFLFYLYKLSCIFQLEHKSFVPYGFCSSFISFESEIQLVALPLGFARVAPAEFYSSVTQCEKVLVSHKSSLRSFTCTIFDFWRCKIKLSCKCALPLPFMLLQYRGVEKKKKQRRQRLREIWSVLPLNIPHSQTTASHCHYKYIRNQLFMEESQGPFNLFLLSN